MVSEAIAPTSDSRLLADVFPLRPIRDEFGYQMAIAILDDLFERGGERDRHQRDYFRRLAHIAARYEEANGLGRPA